MRSSPPEPESRKPSSSQIAGAAARGPLHVVPEPGAAEQARRGGRSRGRVRALLLAALLSIALALAGTYLLAELIGPPAVIAPTGVELGLVVVAAVVWVAVFAAYRMYETDDRRVAPTSFDEVGPLFHALLAGSLVLLVIGQGAKRLWEWSIYSPLEALFFLVIALVTVPLLRGVVRTWVLPAVMRPRRTLIAGAGEVGQLMRR